MINPQDLLNVATGAAREAGELIEKMAAAGVKSADKGFRDIVTEADVAAQNAVVNYVKARFPNHGFIGEEDDDSLSSESETVWIIDPIDGTSNYSRQIPTYCVSIGVAVKGEVVAGAIYDPQRNVMYAAAKGSGATANDEPVQVSTVSELAEASVAADFSRSAENRSNMVNTLSTLIHQVRTMRYIGSAALVMAWVGAGHFDSYFNVQISPWDWAAASIIIQEAGGTVTDMAGGPLNIYQDKTAVLASNGHLHNAILSQLA